MTVRQVYTNVFQNGAAQTDGNNGKQVEVKNIIIQICEWNRMSSEDEYLNMEIDEGRFRLLYYQRDSHSGNMEERFSAVSDQILQRGRI